MVATMERAKEIRMIIGTITYEITLLLEEENRYLKRTVIAKHLINLGLIENGTTDWSVIREEIETNDYGIRYTGTFRGRRYYLDSTPPENHNVEEISDMAYQILKDSPRQMRMTEIMAKLEEKSKEDGKIIKVFPSYIQRTLYQKYPNEFMMGSKRGFWMLKGTHEIDEILFPKYCSNCGTGIKREVGDSRPKYCSNCGFRLRV